MAGEEAVGVSVREAGRKTGLRARMRGTGLREPDSELEGSWIGGVGDGDRNDTEGEVMMGRGEVARIGDVPKDVELELEEEVA